MTRRGLLAIGIVAAWIVGLAAFARRELNRTDAERAEEWTLRVAPGATYFAVIVDQRHVGYASAMIDTVPLITNYVEFLIADVPAGDSLRRHTISSRVRLTRALALREYWIQSTTDSAPRTIRGNVIGDSVLVHVASLGRGRRAKKLDSLQSVLSRRTLALPLVGTASMLVNVPRLGRTTTFASVDPLTGETAQTPVRVVAESLFVVPDSAAFDVQAGKWRAVHNDSVRAWRLDGLGGVLWVDALGRVVRHERPDGFTLQRTAYELAFRNWQATSPLSRKPSLPKS